MDLLYRRLWVLRTPCVPIRSIPAAVGLGVSRRFGTVTVKRSLVAGQMLGYADGVAETAEFCMIQGLICTSDGQTLLVGDGSNCRLRSVDIKTRTVTTLCGDGECENRDGVRLNARMKTVYQICFDRSRTGTGTSKPDSVLFLVTGGMIRRYDRETGP